MESCVELVDFVLANRDVTAVTQAAAGVIETLIRMIADAIGCADYTAVAELAYVLGEPAAGLADQPDPSQCYKIVPNPFMALAAGLIAAALGSDKRLAYAPASPPLRDYEIKIEWHEGAWAFAVWVAAGGAMSRSAPSAAGRTQLLAPEVERAYMRAARAANPRVMSAVAYAPLYAPCLDAWTDTTRDPRRAAAAAAVVAGHCARVAARVPGAKAAGEILGAPDTSRYNWDEMVRATAQFAPASVSRRLNIEHDAGVAALCAAIAGAAAAGDAASGDALVQAFTNVLVRDAVVLLAAALAIPPGALGAGADADQARQRIATAIVARMPGVQPAEEHAHRAVKATREHNQAIIRLAAARAESAAAADESDAEVERGIEQATRQWADATAAAVADALASADVMGRLPRLCARLTAGSAGPAPDLAFAFSVLNLMESTNRHDKHNDRAGLQDWFLNTGPGRWIASTWLGFEFASAEHRPETRGDAGNAAIASNEDVVDVWIAARAAVRGKRPRAAAWPTVEWPGGCGLEPLGFAPLVGAVLAMPWDGPRGARAARTRTLVRRDNSGTIRLTLQETRDIDAQKHLKDLCPTVLLPHVAARLSGAVGVRCRLRVAAYQNDEPGTLANLIRRIPGADAATASGWLADLAEGVAEWRVAARARGVLGPDKFNSGWGGAVPAAHLRRIAPWVALALALAAPSGIIASADAAPGRDRLAREIALASAVGDAIGEAARTGANVRAARAASELVSAQSESDRASAAFKASGADFEIATVALRRIKSAK